MSTTKARIGYGSQFQYSLDGGSTWTTLAEVKDITPPSDTVDIFDGTHMASPDRTKEFVEGLSDPGECSFEMNFVPGSAADLAVQGFRGAGAIPIRIVFPNDVIWTFKGIRTAYEPAVPTEEIMTATVTFKVTGSYVATAAAEPENIVIPAIAGIAQVGEELYAYEGMWTGAPSFSFQWQEDDSGWADIAGATSQEYTPVAGNVGNALRVIVTATNTAGSETATSQPTADVLAE